MKKESIRVAIIGGSGFWSEESHLKHILALKEKYSIELVVIVDPVDPHGAPAHHNLQEVLQTCNSQWLKPGDFSNVDEVIQHLKSVLMVNLVIIASTPCTHYEYGMSCITHAINTICDKPIISHDNASTDPNAARLIAERYDLLLRAYREARKKNPRLLFHSILRRRALGVFIYIAEELQKVHQATGAGVNNMSFIVNGGKYKFPAELASSGAHSYLEGVGSMSHSAYHYLDIMAWYLKCAPGKAYKIRPRLNYVFRVSDYLSAESYIPLAAAINESSDALQEPDLSPQTLGCELNAGFTFDIYDVNGKIVGSNSFLFNLISFTPRTLHYSKDVHEPADKVGGGRMSHIMIDVHQDGLQSWQVTKNDIVFEDNKMHAFGRRHPRLPGSPLEEIVSENAYNSGITLQDLLGEVMGTITDGTGISNHPQIRSLAEERLTTELYAACYKLIADNYTGNTCISDCEIIIQDIRRERI